MKQKSINERLIEEIVFNQIETHLIKGISNYPYFLEINMKQKSINERLIEEIVFNQIEIMINSDLDIEVAYNDEVQIEDMINSDLDIEVAYNDEVYQKVHLSVQNALKGIHCQESIKKLEEKGYYL